MAVQTCRHFRYQVPREIADELREDDPEPCEVCDSMPRRKPVAEDLACRDAQLYAAARFNRAVWDAPPDPRRYLRGLFVRLVGRTT